MRVLRVPIEVAQASKFRGDEELDTCGLGSIGEFILAIERATKTIDRAYNNIDPGDGRGKRSRVIVVHSRKRSAL